MSQVKISTNVVEDGVAVARPGERGVALEHVEGSAYLIELERGDVVRAIHGVHFRFCDALRVVGSGFRARRADRFPGDAYAAEGI